jgi:hypothetical protein
LTQGRLVTADVRSRDGCGFTVCSQDFEDEWTRAESRGNCSYVTGAAMRLKYVNTCGSFNAVVNGLNQALMQVCPFLPGHPPTTTVVFHLHLLMW